ncbi:hypothetical protein BGZ70_009413 [Mortierella alpina]|uniref:Uncharacterized protein n=1 Tax=Mortierella alpina TaxID=64518 RepID=A0A9P6J1J6_MORAP|nr:hypothetical protein BGZ70_009413 [Mortierella alpina]
MNDNHPSCIHSRTMHNTMSMSNSHSAVTGSSLCSCEECSRYKVPFQSLSPEQTSDIFDMLQQQNTNTAMSSAHDRSSSNNDSNTSATSATTPPTTYLARRPSTNTSAISPKVAGYGGAMMMQPHQRRASFEFHNRERSFQQHSGSCDCKGSGVGCGCSFTCDC